MKRMDRKAQMMDAGTALFESKEGFGTSLGQVKAEMKRFGKVYEVSTGDEEADKFHDSVISPAELPESTDRCDLFLDFSSPWRNRYISCLFEDAGDTGKRTADGEHIRRYAATFKEGNTSTPLRAGVHIGLIVIIAVLVVSGLVSGAVSVVAGILLCFLVVYSWLTPSKDSQAIVKGIEAALRSQAD